MGIVNLPIVEDDNEAIVRYARRVSVRIDEYFDTQAYLTEVDSEDLITTQWLRNIALGKIISELQVMGLEFNVDFEDIAGDNYRASFILALFQTFESKFCRLWLSRLSEELLNDVKVILDEVEDTSDLVTDLIEMMSYEFPTNTDWEFLNTHKDLVTSTGEFQAHLKAIMKLIEHHDENSIPVVNDSNIANYETRYKEWATHVGKINDALDILMKKDLELNRITIANKMLTHDVTKTNDLNYDVDKKIQDKHHASNDHHFEYYLAHSMERPTREQLAIIVADEFTDERSTVDYLQALKDGAELAKFTIEEFNQMLDYATQLLDNKILTHNKGVDK